MSQQGRSARRRPQRLARRRAAVQGFDRGGVRRSRLFSRPVIATVGLILAATLIASLAVVAFDSSGPSSTTDPPPVRRTGSDVITGAVEGKPTWNAPPPFALVEGVDYGAEIELESGEIIVIDLLETLAPEHVNNFVFLVNEGFYDGLSFHEVLPGLRAHAGDPTAGDLEADFPADAGYLLPDEPTADEVGDALAVDSEGMVAMRRSEVGVSSSQFFITLSDRGSETDQASTAFGQVTSGIGVLYGFDSRDPSRIPTPLPGPRIVAIRITEDGAVAMTAGTSVESPAAQEKPPPVPDLSLSWGEPPAFALEDGVDYRATIEMVGGGTIEIDLYEDLAPGHVNNFVFLARQGFYDAVMFHRIIHGFMAQGGDPTGFGTGGPGYLLDAEFNETRHVRGVVSMARSADPNSAGSQFFIVYDDAPHLDGQYTAFGEVTSGMDVVAAFPERDPADPSEPPGPQIATITISEAARAQ